jgi:hypothetical protein
LDLHLIAVEIPLGHILGQETVPVSENVPWRDALKQTPYLDEVLIPAGWS